MDERAARMAKRFEIPVVVAALLVIPVIVIEESEPGAPSSTVAAVANWLIWLVFAAELVAMLAVVPSRKAWLRRHPLEVAVVVLTPPFAPASIQAARAFGSCASSGSRRRRSCCEGSSRWRGFATPYLGSRTSGSGVDDGESQVIHHSGIARQPSPRSDSFPMGDEMPFGGWHGIAIQIRGGAGLRWCSCPCE
jgi:hypothetical protein